MIKIFSSDGTFLIKIGEHGAFTFPIHCVQYDKYLIESDQYQHCIKVYDRSGNPQYKFGKVGEGDGEFNYPSCLSVNKSGHMMVCDSDNHRIQVFELNGKFFNNIGNRCGNIGEFSYPISLAVLASGRIVVADMGSNRMQIFE